MPLLDDHVRSELTSIFAEGLRDPVALRLIVSRQAPTAGDPGCLSCSEARDLLSEVVALAPQTLALDIVDLDASPDDPRAEGATDAPMLLIAPPNAPARIRYLGIPAGHEFATIVDAITRVSRVEASITDANAERLRSIAAPIDLKVFVTPSCPYCPAAATIAYRLALVAPNLTATTIEVTEFPELADRYQVRGVPRIVVNDGPAFVGAMPEDRYVDEVLRLVAQPVA